MSATTVERWGVLWREESSLDGKREHLCFESLLPVLFVTRAQAREWANDRYGYIKTRPDLKAEPFGWKMPVPVRVTVSVSAN